MVKLFKLANPAVSHIYDNMQEAKDSQPRADWRISCMGYADEHWQGWLPENGTEEPDFTIPIHDD